MLFRSASLTGNLDGALQLHAFGPVVAAALLTWSVFSIRHRRLLPRELPAWPLGGFAVGLLTYWLMRIVINVGDIAAPAWLHFPLFS